MISSPLTAPIARATEGDRGYPGARMSLFDPFPTLSTQRLRLRALTREDAPAMHRLDADPRVARYLGRPPSASLAAMQERVEALIADLRDERSGYWVIADGATDALLGSACLWNWDRAAAIADLGYMLDPARWGEGLMSEALPPIIAFGRERMALARIEGRVDPANLASIRVLTRLGFIAGPELDEGEAVYSLSTRPPG